MKRTLLVLLLAGMCSGSVASETAALAQGAGASQADAAALKAEIEALRRLVPSQSHAMADVDYHFSNLWFAAHSANWPLAVFYLNETKSHLGWAVRIRPVRKLSSGQQLDLRPILQAAPDRQISLADPDARSMATSGRGTGIVGYKVQTAVDAKHHLIVAHDVTNRGHDRQQLSPMAQQAGQAIGKEQLTVPADRGYFIGEQIRECEQNGIATLVPKPLTSNNKAAGLFDKRDFVDIPQSNEYRCPAGKRAITGQERPFKAVG